MKVRKPLLATRLGLQLNTVQAVSLVLGVVAMVGMGLVYVRSHAATTSFRFAAFSDTKSGTDVLAQISPQVVGLNPVFGLYPGDVCDSGPNSGCMSTWKSAMNGNDSNNLYDRMFVTRGNHDSDGASFWSSNFDFAGLASRIGATNFKGDNFTYSFDYGNSHFIGVDAPEGDSVNISQNQVTWVDDDLTEAEGRGISHSFAWWHGPVHPEGGHCCTDDARFIKVFGKHPSFEAVFSGHEHNIGSTLIDGRWGNSGHSFYEIVTGSAGAGIYSCEAGRSDFCMEEAGFTMVDVNGSDVTINLYQVGTSSPRHTVTIHGVVNPSPSTTVEPSASPSVSPSQSPTPSPTVTVEPSSPTPTPASTPTATPHSSSTPTPSPTATPNKTTGDVDGSGKVDITDLQDLLFGWTTDRPKDDINNDGQVNVYDLSILLSHWGK